MNSQSIRLGHVVYVNLEGIAKGNQKVFGFVKRQHVYSLQTSILPPPPPRPLHTHTHHVRMHARGENNTVSLLDCFTQTP